MLLPSSWVKVDKHTIAHVDGQAKIVLTTSRYPDDHRRHFLVFVAGQWLLQRTWIQPFPTLAAAIAAAEVALEGGEHV